MSKCLCDQYLCLALFILFSLSFSLAAPEREPTCPLCPNPAKTDFRANWIWLPDDIGYEDRNSYVYFRKTFTAAGNLTIDMAADTWYQFYLDGRMIERGTAPSDVNYKIFDTYQVNVTPGQHVLAVLVHHIGQVCATAMKSRPGLLAEISTENGEKIISDATWKAMPALAYQQHLPCMMSHFGFYEVCDGEKIPQGWTEVQFNDSAWRSVQVIGAAGCAPWLRLIPRDIPLLTTQTLSAKTVLSRGAYRPGPIPESEKEITVAVEMTYRLRMQQEGVLSWPLAMAQGSESEYVVLDFGREVTGHVRLNFKPCRAGQTLTVGYDETLDRMGLPNPRRTYVHFADRFYLAANQQQASILGARGFRYLLLDVAGGHGGLILTSVEIEERTYPIEHQGDFHCSDTSLDRLYEIGLTTTRLCMLDTYVDCPSRERVMWMDMYPEAHCSSYGFGITQLWRRCLYLFSQNTCPSGVTQGAVRGFAPCDYDPLLISYMMYYVISAVDYVQHSGDLASGAALFPILMKQFEVIAQYLTAEGLINDKFPGWGTFLDWSAMDFGGISAGNNAIYILMHRKAAQLAYQLHKQDIALELDGQADRLAKTFHKTFWNEKEKLYIDAVHDGKPSPVRSQWVNTMAVLAGVVKGDHARTLLRKIIDPKVMLPRTSGDYRLKPDFKVQTGGIVPIGTPGSGFLLAQALFTASLDQEAIDYYKENWLSITANGTFMEHFVPDANTSYCHGWGAGPVVSFPQYILGVYPLSPGWKNVAIRPHPGALSWAQGIVPTPLGDVQVSWKKVDGEIKLSYHAPAGMQVLRP